MLANFFKSPQRRKIEALDRYLGFRVQPHHHKLELLDQFDQAGITDALIQARPTMTEGMATTLMAHLRQGGIYTAPHIIALGPVSQVVLGQSVEFVALQCKRAMPDDEGMLAAATIKILSYEAKDVIAMATTFRTSNDTGPDRILPQPVARNLVDMDLSCAIMRKLGITDTRSKMTTDDLRACFSDRNRNALSDFGRKSHVHRELRDHVSAVEIDDVIKTTRGELKSIAGKVGVSMPDPAAQDISFQNMASTSLLSRVWSQEADKCRLEHEAAQKRFDETKAHVNQLYEAHATNASDIDTLREKATKFVEAQNARPDAASESEALRVKAARMSGGRKDKTEAESDRLDIEHA